MSSDKVRIPLSVETLLRLDRQHVWHPYSAMPATIDCVPIESASDVYLNVRTNDADANSIRLVDGMSSWWAAVHGYNHPVLNRAVMQQLNQMSHVMLGGLTHEPAVRLAYQLAQLTGLPHVFFSDSGSVAVEVAMKLALQYWYCQGRSHKSKFLTVQSGYHGDTLSAMSVCDPVNGMHHMFPQSVLPQQLFANAPTPNFHDDWDDSIDHMKSLKDLLEQHQSEIAAVILEPIVQGAGGMRFYHAEYLRQVRSLCHDYNVLLIADEIATGFGRTGQLLACHHANVLPDILCLGKALSGGYMSFAATLTTAHVADVFQHQQHETAAPPNVLMHGPTFMGNPLACAVSLASVNLLLDEKGTNWNVAVPAIERQLRAELEPCRESSLVQDVRVLGAIGVVEFKQAIPMKAMQPAIVKQGVWLRPFGKLLYTMPPFIIQPHQLRKITQAMVHLTRMRF